MKVLFIPTALFLLGCLGSAAGDSSTVNAGHVEYSRDEKVYADFFLDPFLLSLVDRDGLCTLKSHNKSQEDQVSTHSLKMSGPCEFVRSPSKDHQPLFYTYQRGDKKRTVLIVTGGKPHPTIRDQFMPKGCGTYLAKVLVFRDHVEVIASGKENGPAACPSYGMDEVFFAA